jgi:hypothetical protein
LEAQDLEFQALLPPVTSFRSACLHVCYHHLPGILFLSCTEWRLESLLAWLLLQVKVTVLADNDPSSQFHYLIQVFTGYRRSAATTAKVSAMHAFVWLFSHEQCFNPLLSGGHRWHFLVLNCKREALSEPKTSSQ